MDGAWDPWGPGMPCVEDMGLNTLRKGDDAGDVGVCRAVMEGERGKWPHAKADVGVDAEEKWDGPGDVEVEEAVDSGAHVRGEGCTPKGRGGGLGCAGIAAGLRSEWGSQEGGWRGCGSAVAGSSAALELGSRLRALLWVTAQ
uniref:Uncharacterized protein n=1 Tax=Eutreptiella gymnastica TaxID=73025 RepID=A0A7S4D0X1_9EUGL